MIDFFDSNHTLPLEVTVDDREPNDLLLEFRKRGNIILSKKRLAVGDILFDNQLLVERKTVADFCQSLIQGRLFDQIVRMLKSKINAVLIIEGSENDFDKSGVRPNALKGAIVSISLKFKVPILRSTDISQTVDILLQCYRQIEQVADVYAPNVWKKRLGAKHAFDPIYLKKLRVLTSFPGLGQDRAMKLIQKFSTLERIFASSKEDFLSVEGIGKKSWNGFDEILRR
ncbi:MAG: ERCC4 domain-containing protein [Cecembia sp.]